VKQRGRFGGLRASTNLHFDIGRPLKTLKRCWKTRGEKKMVDVDRRIDHLSTKKKYAPISKITTPRTEKQKNLGKYGPRHKNSLSFLSDP